MAKTSSIDKSVSISFKVTTVLIIVLSLVSVVSIFLINDIQGQVQTNLKTADKWNSMVEVIEKDITKILDEDAQKQQMALSLQHQFLYLNDLIIQMKEYNLTVKPGLYTQADIDLLIMQAAAQLEIVNDYIRDTYAFNWTAENGGNETNGYEYLGLPNYLIVNNWGLYNGTLDTQLLSWLITAYSPYTPEILQVDLYYWEGELFWNASIIFEYGDFSKLYANILGIDLQYISYYDMQFFASDYEWFAELYQVSASNLTSALLLLTIAAVVLAYVVSISGKKFIWISLTIGVLVALIGIFMFYNGMINLMDANMLSFMPLFGPY